ncbi:PAS domain S-box protein [Ideonella azotifigens]|uniref:PAS domain-containing protein n=1 Tax=Ideonella azotifigens TaxID=513160 RepID=A0ABN1JZ95_9BURK|nr:PAS domain S-box protein [Ideonella azotifigens]
MSSQIVSSGNPMDLRSRAALRLNGRGGANARGTSPSEALVVLFELASSPATAPDALALLHELQVHQVELELQGEELLDSRAELEEALARQTALYDFAPVGHFTLGAGTLVCELNLTGARWLGCEREAVLGRALDSFLDRRSADKLHALLAGVGEGRQGDACELNLALPGGRSRAVHACAARDLAGGRFLVTLVELGERQV